MFESNKGVTLHLPDLVRGYVETVDYIMEHGEEVAPDGKLTVEVLAMTLVLPGDSDMLPFGTGRKVNRALAAEDALQVIGGFSSLPRFERINPNMVNYTDQHSFHGAYGPRIRPQMDNVIRRLREDPASRRAVVTIWDPLRDGNTEGMSNYPCTTELQFMVREGKVDCHTTMRANDVWHGLAYDAFVFNQLQRTVANVLRRPVGVYYHHATSLHVYEKQWDEAGKLDRDGGDASDPLPNGLQSFDDARYIADHTSDLEVHYDYGARWYHYWTNLHERGAEPPRLVGDVVRYE